MERITTIKGDYPALIIVPHGHDDPNTPEVAEQIITELNCYGVINRGWERADSYDYYTDKANCNNVAHIHEDVVREEFLDPILEFKENIEERGHLPNVFIIHGVGSNILKQAPDLDFIIGYGAGKPPSYTCEQWYKELFMEYLSKLGFHPYQGKAGGAYSARRSENLNQLFTSHYYDEMVASMQIEIAKQHRITKVASRQIGAELAMCIEDLIETRNTGMWNDVILADKLTTKFPEI